MYRVVTGGVCVVLLTGCGRSAPEPSPSTPKPSAASTASSPSSQAVPANRPVPDAKSIAGVLLAMAHRPGFLDPFGSQIGGKELGLGPDLRIAGYRADPLFVCVQHVDMRAGTAGAWTAYTADASGGHHLSAASGGRCPTAPGRTDVRE